MTDARLFSIGFCIGFVLAWLVLMQSNPEYWQVGYYLPMYLGVFLGFFNVLLWSRK